MSAISITTYLASVHASPNTLKCVGANAFFPIRLMQVYDEAFNTANFSLGCEQKIRLKLNSYFDKGAADSFYFRYQ